MYLTIAHRCADSGQTGRAIVTIVNTLKNNPSFMDSQPESVEFLAEILVPGFEEEIHALEARFPVFGDRLRAALRACGKDSLASQLEESFSAYCFECMKSFQVREHSRSDMSGRLPEPINQVYQPSVPVCETAEPAYRQAAIESGLYKPASRTTWRKQATDSPERLAELSKDVWMPSIQEMTLNHNGQAAYEKRLFTSRNTDSCQTEGVRRFDRIRTQQIQEPEAAKDYADTAADRIILDFDNSVRESNIASAMFSETKTSFKSYAEELAEWRASIKDETPKQFGAQPVNPLDAVAETTQALSETPSVEPYTVRHPIRFRLTPQNIATCVFICILVMFGFVTWRTAEPVFENRAIEGVSNTYIQAAEMGSVNPVKAVDESHQALVDDTWLTGYRQFLTVWQNLHYKTEDAEYLDPESPDFASESSAAHAALIMQEVARNHNERARMYFQNVPASVWRGRSCFKTWAEAELDTAARDFKTASIRYEKLLKSPLAPFALVRLGLLSLEEGPAQVDIQQRFLRAADSAEVVPGMARCIRGILDHQNELHISQSETANLKTPFAEYCAMGRVFRAIHKNDLISDQDLDILESSQPLEHGESWRYEAIIEAELYRQQPERAIAWFNAFNLPVEHPVRRALLNQILDRSAHLGSWKSLSELNRAIPSNLNYLAAARIIDNARLSGIIEPDGKRYAHLFMLNAPAASSAISSIMDEALVEAESGHFNRAEALAQTQMSRLPDLLEPILLQAEILARTGRPHEAAILLEQSINSGHEAAPLLVMSNLYRARAHLELNRASTFLSRLSFQDPLLEAARCEIFWRHGDKNATTCLKSLEMRDMPKPKSVWIMTHLDSHQKPEGTAAQWAKAGSGSLYFPGYYLAYARKLIESGDFKQASRYYTRAILKDDSTSTPEVVEEFAKAYLVRQRRYEGTQKFDELISASQTRPPEVLGAMHLAAAKLHQPENGHSTARMHLGKALDLLGDRPEILKGLVQYYESRGKDDQAAMWRSRLYRIQSM